MVRVCEWVGLVGAWDLVCVVRVGDECVGVCVCLC